MVLISLLLLIKATPETIIVYNIIYGLAFVIFAINIHRITLLGVEHVPKYGLSWQKREWIFVLYTIGIYILITILSFILSPIALIFASSSLKMGFIASFILMLVISLLFVRLSVIFPAIATDKYDIGWKWAMETTQNNALRLFVVLVIIPSIATIVVNKIANISIFLYILAQIFTLFVFLFEIVALSLSYKYLSDED